MAQFSPKKRKLASEERDRQPKPKKRVRKQAVYHSSSESEASEDSFAPVNLDNSDDNTAVPAVVRIPAERGASPSEREDLSDKEDRKGSESAASSRDEGSDAGENGRATKRKTTSKRNDPEAFSTSISKILGTKLPQSARKDPVLSRSREAAEARDGLADEALERKAKARLKAERREDLKRGRVKDVLGLTTGDAGKTAEEEKRLRKIAQRGVVKLFNAVRAAQVKGEEAAREERKKGTVGYATRQEKATEMSKQGFLDLINGKSQTTQI